MKIINNKYTIQLVLSLLISFLPINSSYSKDIYDADIYGYKVSESLLHYFTIKEIQGMEKEVEGGTKNKFIRYEHLSRSKDGDYDGFTFIIRKDDPDMILYSISAGKFFGKNNLEICQSKKEKLEKKLLKIYPNVKPQHYTYRYDYGDYNGESVAYITMFKLEGGVARVFCVDWSPRIEEKKRYVDNLQIEIASEIFMKNKK